MRIPLQEVKPGSYEGTYKVQPGDYIRDGQLTACLVNRQGDRSLPAAADDPVRIDTTVTIAITPAAKCLKADGKSRTEILVEVKDAREAGVENREVALELFTTDEYTGIVGVGRFDEHEFGRFDEHEYGYFDTLYHKVTDPVGRITVPYISGLAAKTLIIRGRDKVTGCVGLGYITSYLEGLINLQLVDPPAKKLGRSSPATSLTAWAENEWLTADAGFSSTRVHAKVLDQDGKPLPGHHLSFTLTDGEGRIEELQPETDSSGQALARYFSGKHIGTAEITVVDTSLNLSLEPSTNSNAKLFSEPSTNLNDNSNAKLFSASILVSLDEPSTNLSARVYIILKSDAPSKIELEGAPLSIPADGASTSDLTIRVADINDNPNRGVPLEVEITQGGGKLIMLDSDAVSNLFGECHLKYVAGTRPGTVTIRARALSSVPSPQVLDKIRTTEHTEYH
jgi:hypothetical protein